MANGDAGGWGRRRYIVSEGKRGRLPSWFPAQRPVIPSGARDLALGFPVPSKVRVSLAGGGEGLPGAMAGSLVVPPRDDSADT